MNKFVKILFLAIVILCTALPELHAGDTYPFSFHNPIYEPGGKLIVNHLSSKSDLTYFLKYNWAGESEVIYNWAGIKRSDVRGSSCGNIFILNEVPVSNKLLAVWRDNNKVFIGWIDSLNYITVVDEITSKAKFETMPQIADFIKINKPNEILLKIEDKLFLCSIANSKFNMILISQNVIKVSTNFINYSSAKKNNSKNIIKYAFLSSYSGFTFLYAVDFNNTQHFLSRIGYSDDYSISCFGDKIAFVSSNKIGAGALVQLFHGFSANPEEFKFETNADRIIFDEVNSEIYAYYLQNTQSGYFFVKSILDKSKRNQSDNINEIGFSFIENMLITKVDNFIYCIFRNGIIVYDQDCNRQASDFIPIGEYMNEISNIYRSESELVLASQKASLIVDVKYHSIWFINSFLRNTGKLIVPIILAALMIICLQLYRHQKRLLKAVLDLPSSGVVLVTDRVGRLRRSNISGEKFLSITHSVPKGKLFQFYCTEEKTQELKNLVDKALISRDSITQKLMFTDGLDTKEWIFNVLPLKNITGQFRGLVITGFDITAELSKNKLHNWAQLAHDMQTNLSTIRLNAEQIESDSNADNSARKEKILHQVSILIQRIRDIVTVGRSNVVEKQEVSAEEMCIEVRNEFDSVAFPNVNFVLNTQNLKVECDKPKMIRALRNAVENGIRSMKELKGKIIISNWEDGRYSYFSVKDSGLGMDEETKKKMLTPYFTTSQNKGGSGIGTMIMQHVIELHGGEMTINSEKGKGTEIVFCIPHKSNRRKK